jgi:hypothetical protein
MIAPLLHARPLIAPTTRMHTVIPEWQLRRVQRELDLCRRLMHASRKRDRTSTIRALRHGAGAPRGARRKPDICRPSAGAPLAFREHSDDRVR